MTRTIFLIVGLLFCSLSQASLWSITDRFQGSHGQFGFSSLQDDEMHFNAGEYLHSFGYSGSYSARSYSGHSQGKTNPGASIPRSGLFGFHDGQVCCGGGHNPKSFLPLGGGDLNYITLWGGNIWAGNYPGSTVGMYIKPELSPVPIPAAVYLFGTALLGLFGYQRRKPASRI